MSANQRATNWLLKALAAVASAVLLLPLVAILARVPWGSVTDLLTAPETLATLRVSIVSSLIAAMCALIIGVPLAWVLARSKSRAMRILRSLVLAPLVLPPTVAGIALLALLGRSGIIGQPIYEATGWAMPFTFIAVIFAGLFVGLPFLVLLTETAFVQLERETEFAAQTDGATPWQVFWRIAVPQVRVGIVTGGVMAWARAFGEFGATLMFAGSLPGTTRTIPMQVYTDLELNPSSAYALSALMIVVAAAVTFAIRTPLINAARNL